MSKPGARRGRKATDLSEEIAGLPVPPLSGRFVVHNVMHGNPNMGGFLGFDTRASVDGANE